jgi:hypothetical protein
MTPFEKLCYAWKIRQLKYLMKAAWCRDTASPDSLSTWEAHHSVKGQCAVTALVVQDEMGGEILRTVVEGYGSHYYNRLPDGTILDLTKEQFPAGIVIPPGTLIERDAMLFSERAKEARTLDRYHRLKRNFDQGSRQELYRNVPPSERQPLSLAKEGLYEPQLLGLFH